MKFALCLWVAGSLTNFRGCLLCFMLLACFNALAQLASQSTPIRIGWETHLPGRGTAGNFSFARKWDYPPGVERMSNSKPGCADGGFCPERCQNMLDEKGRSVWDKDRF